MVHLELFALCAGNKPLGQQECPLLISMIKLFVFSQGQQDVALAAPPVNSTHQNNALHVHY